MVVARSDYEPELFTKAYQSLFFHVYDTTPDGDWTKLAMTTQSTTSSEKYFGIGAIPKLSEFTDERKILGLGPKFTYEIANKKYEGTISVRRDEIEDDQYNMIETKIRQLASETKNFYNELVFSYLDTGTSALGFDGLPMFSATHNNGSGNQSNLFDLDVSKANFQTAITQMSRYKDEKGRALNIKPTHVICPPELAWDIRELLNAQTFVADGVGSTASLKPQFNGLQGALNMIVTPHLGTSTEYYLADLSKPIKPIIFQNRVAPEFVALDNPVNNEAAFMRDYYYYGVRLRCGVGFGPWMYMAKMHA